MDAGSDRFSGGKRNRSKTRRFAMKAVSGKQVVLKDGELLRRERSNRDYLMSLSNEDLQIGRAHV